MSMNESIEVHHTELLADPNVHLLTHAERKIFLIGTAHVSRRSVELVERVIRATQPNAVAVELCDSRFQAMRDPQRWRNMDIYKVIKEGKAYVLMAQLVLASFQKRLGDQLEVKPGDEMRRAMDVSDEIKSDIVLADRDVKISLKRAWAKTGSWSLLRILGSLITSLFADHKLDEAEIERLRQVDALESVLAEFSQYLPAVKEVLIDERDKYLAAKILAAPGAVIVAVVGAGHVPGIKKHLGTNVNLSDLETIPPPRLSTRLVTWGIPLSVIALLLWAFLRVGEQFGKEMLTAWVRPHARLAGMVALVALGHPLTILTAVIVAPYTALNPLVAAGWFAGLTEAILRKPRVSDLENLTEDIATARGLWQNRVSKVLLVMALANVGSSLGTLVGFGWIASLFGR